MRLITLITALLLWYHTSKDQSIYFDCEASEICHLANSFRAISIVESSCVPDTVNEKENAVGIAQIRPIMTKEVNRISKGKKFDISDCLCPFKSFEMFEIVQKYHNKTLNINKMCYLWNTGKGYQTEAGKRYFEKVKRYL